MSEEDNHVTHRGAITVAVMLATLMQVLDMTIATVALPHMQGSFATSLDNIKLVLTSFIVAAAVATPMMGWLADRYGRRNVLLVTVTGFAVFSFMVGVSTSLMEVVVARAMQGAFGAAFVPLSQAILLDVYPREKHGTAMAIWGMGIMAGPILGPTVGGYITEFYNWRWNFFINVPVGVLTFLMLWTFLPTRDHGQSKKFDFVGFIILGIGIGALQYLLDRGNDKNWFSSTQIVVSAGLAAILLWIYPWYASLKKDPFVSLKLFKDRNYAIGSVVMLMLGVVLLATVSLLPPFMESLLNFPVFATGLILAPRGIGAMIAMILVGRLVTRVNPRTLLVSGLLINIFALYELSQMTLNVDPTYIIWTGFIQGLGLGQVFVPLTTVAFSTLPGRLRNEAAPLFNLFRNVGSAIGISIVFTLLTRNTQINHELLAKNISSFNPNFLRYLHEHLLPKIQGMGLINGQITRHAMMISYNNDFLFMAALVVLMIPLTYMLKYEYGSEAEMQSSVME